MVSDEPEAGRSLTSMYRRRVVGFGDLYTSDARTLQAFDLARRVAREGRMPFLIVGESGTGKNVVAQSMHNASGRMGEFVSVGVADLPDTMSEAALFGARRGAYTGATEDRPGLVEQAGDGTLFFEDVGDLAADVQKRLLTLLDTGEYRVVGGTRVRRSTARIGAAVHEDPEALVGAGRLRRDLLHRLQGGLIRLPPLRERGDDAVLVARRLLEAEAAGGGRAAKGMSAEAEERLRAHAWPGNLRELRRVLQVARLGDGDVIGVEDLGPLGHPQKTGGSMAPHVADGEGPNSYRLEDAERWAIERALRKCNGHRGRTARLLDISEAKLYRDLKRFGLSDVR